MIDVMKRTDFRGADENDVCLISSFPTDPHMPDEHADSGTLGEVGVNGLRAAWSKAHYEHQHGGIDGSNGGGLAVSVVNHSINGWTGRVGKDSAEAFQRAATGGDDAIPIRLFWPKRHDSDELMGWTMRFEAPDKVDSNYTSLNGYNGYSWVEYKAQHVQARVHLMMYLLHDQEPPHTVHRVVVGSTNFSTAAWGRVQPGGLEVRNFELSVSFPPQQRVPKTYNVATKKVEEYYQSFGESLPFNLAHTQPCTDPCHSKREAVAAASSSAAAASATAEAAEAVEVTEVTEEEEVVDGIVSAAEEGGEQSGDGGSTHWQLLI